MTILPAVEELEEALESIKKFHANFVEKYS
jgi:hypothetical protein